MCMCVCVSVHVRVTALSMAPTWGRSLVKWVGLDLGVNNSHHVIKNSINTAEYCILVGDAPSIKRFIKYKMRKINVGK